MHTLPQSCRDSATPRLILAWVRDVAMWGWITSRATSVNATISKLNLGRDS